MNLYPAVILQNFTLDFFQCVREEHWVEAPSGWCVTPPMRFGDRSLPFRFYAEPAKGGGGDYLKIKGGAFYVVAEALNEEADEFMSVGNGDYPSVPASSLEVPAAVKAFAEQLGPDPYPGGFLRWLLARYLDRYCFEDEIPDSNVKAYVETLIEEYSSTEDGRRPEEAIDKDEIVSVLECWRPQKRPFYPPSCPLKPALCTTIEQVVARDKDGTPHLQTIVVETNAFTYWAAERSVPRWRYLNDDEHVEVFMWVRAQHAFDVRLAKQEPHLREQFRWHPEAHPPIGANTHEQLNELLDQLLAQEAQRGDGRGHAGDAPMLERDAQNVEGSR